MLMMLYSLPECTQLSISLHEQGWGSLKGFVSVCMHNICGTMIEMSSRCTLDCLTTCVECLCNEKANCAAAAAAAAMQRLVLNLLQQGFATVCRCKLMFRLCLKHWVWWTTSQQRKMARPCKRYPSALTCVVRLH